MIVVEDIHSIPPKNNELIKFHFKKKVAKAMPVDIIPAIITIAAITAELPTFINFLKLNSRPKVNNRNMMPISAQTCISFRLEKNGRNPLPANIPTAI